MTYVAASRPKVFLPNETINCRHPEFLVKAMLSLYTDFSLVVSRLGEGKFSIQISPNLAKPARTTSANFILILGNFPTIMHIIVRA